MKKLYNEDDFYWYKKKLDVDGKHNYVHVYEPERYPCYVESIFCNDSDSPYTYDHYFYYQQKAICKECGRITFIWPE